MFRMLVWIDQWILGEFERLSHVIQKLTGKDCFWVARVVNYVLLLMGCRKISELPVTLMLWLALRMVIIFAEKVARKSMADGLKNRIGRPDPVGALPRLGICIPIIGCVVRAMPWEATYDLLYFTLLFLVACTPLPPAKSKIREWVEALSAKSILAPAEG